MERNEEKQDILAAYALGALNEVEAREFAAEIESDEDLRRELEAWENVAANLTFAAPPAEPSPQVRENLLAAIKKTPQKTEDGKILTEPLKIVEKAKKPPQKLPEKAGVIQFPKRAPRLSFWSYAPAIAASIVAVLLGVALYTQNQASRSQLAELNQKLENAEQKLSELQAQLERERQERELLASPASAVFALNGTENMPTAKARLVFDPKTGKAMLFVEGLPDAPAGKVYQIWWITDPKKPAPGGTFKTNENGKGVLKDQIPPQFTNASIFAVTLEPEGGSTAPTSKPYLITQS